MADGARDNGELRRRHDVALYEAATLDAAIRHFLAQWTPPDREDEPVRRDFEADFVCIVQRIYREAQVPFIEKASLAMALAPMPPIILTKGDQP